MATPSIDLAELDKQLPPKPDDNEPVVVPIDEAKGFVKGNVIVAVSYTHLTLPTILRV